MARKKKEISEAIREAVKPKKRGRKAKEKPMIEFKEGLKDIEKIETVPLADIDLEDRRFQYRVKEKTSDLIPSLISEGQLVPVILWGKKPPYKLVDGYRRAAAVKHLGWPSLRAIIRTDIDEEGAYRLSFIENVKRKNFSPLDMAYAIWKMQARGKTAENLQEEFKLSRTQIGRYEALIAFAEPIKAALADGKITMAHAQVLNTFEVHEIEPWVEKIQNGLSAKELKRELQDGGVIARGSGKEKRYFKTEDDGFRLFPIRFSFNLSEAKQQKIAEVLRKALAIIEKNIV